MSFNPDPQKQAVELLLSRKRNEVDHTVILFNDIPEKKNAINMTFACLTICASAVAIAFNAMTINRFSSCVGSYGKSYCDEASPIRRRYHVPVLAGFVLVTCVAISIVTLTSIQVSRLRRMVIVQQQQAHIVPSSVMVQSSGVVTTSYPAGYPAGYPMSTGMTVPYNVPLSYAPQGYSQAYTTGPPGGNPQMAYTTSAGQMQPANPTAMTYSQPGAVGGAVGAEKQADAPPPYQ
eukprot:Seg299.8 transcript_id=Seg299.8/GoldUCD/mRNA.D3Y31 product="hypothetical protein" protein_id=Seg299.8/GoldUCD/D3Y31